MEENINKLELPPEVEEIKNMVYKKELIYIFQSLYSQGLITERELQRASLLAQDKYINN